MPVLINNPLLGPETPQDLDKLIGQFYRDEKLHDTLELDILIKGGRLVRDPSAYEHIPGLTLLEKKILDDEKDLNTESSAGYPEQVRRFGRHIIKLPHDFRVVLATCCLAAIVQGWNQSNLNGANLQWPREFCVPVNILYPYERGPRISHCPPSDPGRNIWIFGAVNAISYFAAATVGCWLSDPLNEYVGGRRGGLFIAALTSFAACIGSAYTQSWQALLATRIVTGIGMGAKASITPIFLAETATTAIRGTLLTSWQALDAFGIMLGFAANLAVHGDWRKQMASAFIPALPLLLLVPLCAESPRWLLKRGRIKDSYKSMLRLRGSSILACRDLLLMHAQLQAETKYFKKPRSSPEINTSLHDPALKENILFGYYQQEIKTTKPWNRFGKLFTSERTRNASVNASLVMLSQVLCGVNLIFFLGSTVFSNVSESSDPNLGDLRPLWMSFGIGLANFLFVAPAWGTIDKRGRRYLLNWSFPLMALFVLIAGLCFTPHASGGRKAVVVIFLYFFVLAYSVGEGPVAFTLSAEVFPLVNREVGMSFAVFWNMLGNGVLALVIPQLAYATTYRGLLCIFAGFNIMLWVLNFFIIRETANIRLEELNKTFEVSNARHYKYQWDRLKWWTDRHVRRNREARRPGSLWVWESRQEMNNNRVKQ
ncbi:MAG: hypothetical protein Q9227_001355 [Pyrenula ochraceoflavens]